MKAQLRLHTSARPLAIPAVKSLLPLLARARTTLAPHDVIQQQQHLWTTCKALSDKDVVATESIAAPVAPEVDVEAPFLESAVRSFVLGAGAGVLLELLHVLAQFTSFAAAAGETLPSVLPEVVETLAPLVAWDNLLAVTCCAMFYGMEVSAILPVLKQHPDDSKTAARVINRLPTLPKRLMPVKLASIKRALYALIALRNPAAALSNASAFLDDTSPSGRTTSGPAVLDRPPTAGGAPVFPPTIGAPGGPLPQLPKGAPPGLLDLPPVDTHGRSVAPGVTTKKPKLVRNKQPTLPKPPVQEPQSAPETGKAPGKGVKPGAWDPSKDIPMSRRMRELRERRAYLKNFWYAAALSQNLGMDKPLEVKIMGRTAVLFRDEDGVAKCLDNLCPHRGAPLSKGWTQDVDGHNCVVCPYHGWAFDGQGKLRDVPSSSDRSHLPKRPLVDSYPVVEQGGFVWLFFGSKDIPADERPPIPSCPELTDPSWQAVYAEMEFDAPHWSVFDNALDMAHIHYLHSDSFGNSSKPEIMDMTAEVKTWNIEGSFRIYNKPVNPLWEWTAVDSVPVQYKAWMPSTSFVKISLGAGVQMITFVNTVPIDANRSINRFCLIRNFAGWEGFDVWAKNAMFKILSEDKVMVEQLRPESMRAEVSLEADLPQIALRKLRQSWVDMGYAVDPETLEGHNGTLDM